LQSSLFVLNNEQKTKRKNACTPLVGWANIPSMHAALTEFWYYHPRTRSGYIIYEAHEWRIGNELLGILIRENFPHVFISNVKCSWQVSDVTAILDFKQLTGSLFDTRHTSRMANEWEWKKSFTHKSFWLITTFDKFNKDHTCSFGSIKKIIKHWKRKSIMKPRHIHIFPFYLLFIPPSVHTFFSAFL
jgi:hypothetical protein